MVSISFSFIPPLMDGVDFDGVIDGDVLSIMTSISWLLTIE